MLLLADKNHCHNPSFSLPHLPKQNTIFAAGF